jgi:Uma2 family endonuclease
MRVEVHHAIMEGVSMEHSMATGTARLTHADYLLFPDDGKRHELIGGEHFVTPSANLRHQRISANLFRRLDSFLREHQLGEVFFAPLDVIFTDHDVVEPDLIVVLRERSAILQDWVRGVPDLLVEIVSPSNRRHDEVRKRDLYERVGVSEYWLVDPEVEMVKVYRREGPRFGRPEQLSLHRADVLTSSLLPGFSLPLAEVFGD